jgi:phosphatidylglycerophosphate synthase
LAYDPISVRAIYLLQNCSLITPNRLTLFSFLVGIPGIVFFALGQRLYLGVIFFQLFMLIDAVDGKLARVKECPTKFGAILDSLVGGLMFVSYTAALAIGGYYATGERAYLLAALLLFALYALTYIMELGFEGTGLNKSFVVEFAEGQDETSNAAVKSSPLAKLTSYLKERRLVPYPTAIEVFLILFGVAPLIGQILLGIYIAAGYYLLRLIIKFAFLSRPLLKEG